MPWQNLQPPWGVAVNKFTTKAPNLLRFCERRALPPKSGWPAQRRRQTTAHCFRGPWLVIVVLMLDVCLHGARQRTPTIPEPYVAHG